MAINDLISKIVLEDEFSQAFKNYHQRLDESETKTERFGANLRGIVTVAGVAIRASGGGIRSTLWRQILADVLGTEIVTVKTQEGAAFGAALLASVGAGMHATIEEAVDRSVEVVPAAEPGQDAALYAERHAIYRRLYPALSPTFNAL